MKRPEVDNTQNLDLNTTARKNEKTIEKFSPYLINATYCVLQANLSYPIGSFNEEKELAALGEEKKTGGKPTEPDEKTQQQTISQEEGQDMVQQSGRLSQRTLGLGTVQEEFDINGAIFERMIIIVPYKSPDTVKHIEA